MFVIKKMVSAFLLPPGVFVLLLALVGAVLLARKKMAGGVFNLAVAALIWALSTAPDRRYGWQDFLPSSGSLDMTSDALHEYLGQLYYRLVPVR